MKDIEYNNLIDLAYMGGGWIPANEKANELSEQSVKGEITTFKECTARDLKFHRCYFSLINYIYEYMPKKFKRAVLRDIFYTWIKHLQGKYKILYEFKDGTKMVEYESISFGNMSQKRFKEYVREQISYIYEFVIGKFFEGDIYNSIIDTIEIEYEKFLNRL